MPTRRAMVLSLSLAVVAPLAMAAGAYPERPVAVVVPFPAGGSVDAIMRLLQPRIMQELGQPLVIENVGGASGALGASKVAMAQNDGYLLLAGTINDVVLAPVFNRNVRYKPQDFMAVGIIGSTPSLLVARRDLSADSIDAIIERLHSKPESLTYGSPGIGTFQHLVMEDLETRAGVRMVHVPYKGSAQIVNDLLGGQVDLAVMVPSTALPHIQAKRLKVIGLAQSQRLPQFPQIPTLNEGRHVSGIDAAGWMGLFAPKGLAADRAARLRSALYAALADREIIRQLSAIGMQVSGPDERQHFGQQVERDEAKARSLTVKVR